MIPGFVYQYTTLDSVIKILKNRTIRFRRLDALNDLIEGAFGEYSHLKKHVFISSWTSESKESIPMWSLYGKTKEDLKDKTLNTAIRLKIPTNLFTWDENGMMKQEMTMRKFPSDGDTWNIINTLQKPMEIKVNEEVDKLVYAKEPDLYKVKEVIGPVKVRYLSQDNFKEKYSNLVEKIKDSASQKIFGGDGFVLRFNPDQIGFEKVDVWSYEQEYRYWLKFPNSNYVASPFESFMQKDFTFTENNYIDVAFNPEAIKDMEVTLGPNTQKSEKEGIEKLLMSNELTRISSSQLKVKI